MFIFQNAGLTKDSSNVLNKGLVPDEKNIANPNLTKDNSEKPLNPGLNNDKTKDDAQFWNPLEIYKKSKDIVNKYQEQNKNKEDKSKEDKKKEGEQYGPSREDWEKNNPVYGPTRDDGEKTKKKTRKKVKSYKISKTQDAGYNPSKMLDKVETIEDKASLLKKYYDNYNNRECLVKLIYNMDGRSMAGDLSIKGVKITNEKVEEILKDADALMRKLYPAFNPDSMSADQKTIFMIITHQLASGYTQEEVADRIKAINGKTPKEAADLLVSMEKELGAKSGVFGYIKEMAGIYSQDYAGTEISPSTKTVDSSKVSMMATIQEDTIGLLPFYDNLLKLGLWSKVEEYFGKDDAELTPEQKAHREAVMVNGVFDKTLLTKAIGQITDYYNTIDLLKTDPRVTDILALYKNVTGKDLTDDELRIFADNISGITPPLFSVGKLLENFKEAQKNVPSNQVDYSQDKDMKVLYEISKLEINSKGKVVAGSIYDILYMAGYVTKDKKGNILLTEKAEQYFEGSIFTHTQDLKDAVKNNQLTPETAFFLNMITTGQLSSKVIMPGGKSLGGWGVSKWELREGAKGKMDDSQVAIVNSYLKLFADSGNDDGQIALAKSLFSGDKGKRPIDILFSTNAAVLGKTSAPTTTNPLLVTILSDPELSRAFYFNEDGSMRENSERTELQVKIENGKKYDKESITAVIKEYDKELLKKKEELKKQQEIEIKKDDKANEKVDIKKNNNANKVEEKEDDEVDADNSTEKKKDDDKKKDTKREKVPVVKKDDIENNESSSVTQVDFVITNKNFDWIMGLSKDPAVLEYYNKIPVSERAARLQKVNSLVNENRNGAFDFFPKTAGGLIEIFDVVKEI